MGAAVSRALEVGGQLGAIARALAWREGLAWAQGGRKGSTTNLPLSPLGGGL